MCEIMEPTSFPDLLNLSQSQGQFKWYKMVEINDPYNHGGYEKDVAVQNGSVG